MQFIAILILMFLTVFTVAQDEDPVEQQSLSIDDFKFKAFLEVGRFQFTKDDDTRLTSNRRYYHRLGAVLDLDKKLNSVMSVHLEGQWITWRNQEQAPSQFHITYITQTTLLKQANLNFNWDKVDFTVGLIKYKYTASKNLGEYLYRSHSYPTILYTSQALNILDDPSVTVLGASVNWSWANGRIKHIFNGFFEQETFPIYDFTPSYHLYYQDEYIKIGGAISLDRFIHFREAVIDSNPTVRDAPNNFDYAKFIDSTGIDNFYSTKISFQIDLNLGNILNLSYVSRSAEQFSLYSEVAVLGLENHEPIYAKRSERTPIVVGFNLPLNNLSKLSLPNINFELEYLKNPYLSRALSKELSFVPEDLGAYSRDDYKWSFFLIQPIHSRLNLKIRLASDHLRVRVPFNNQRAFEGLPVTNKTIDYLAVVRLEWTN